MNIPEQGQLVCLSCGKKNGYTLPIPTIWHYATCVKCHGKLSVTTLIKPTPQ